MRFLSVRPEICLQLPSDSTSRWTPLLFSYTLPTTWVCSGLSPVRARPWRANERAPPGAPRQKGLEKAFPILFFHIPRAAAFASPSPRKAQKRLGWEVSLAMMNRPPASTSSASARLSHASPNILEECPHPPPWVRPPAAAPVLIQDMSKGRRGEESQLCLHTDIRL